MHRNSYVYLESGYPMLDAIIKKAASPHTNKLYPCLKDMRIDLEEVSKIYKKYNLQRTKYTLRKIEPTTYTNEKFDVEGLVTVSRVTFIECTFITSIQMEISDSKFISCSFLKRAELHDLHNCIFDDCHCSDLLVIYPHYKKFACKKDFATLIGSTFFKENLQYLFLQKNQIEHLPSEIGKLTKLTHLNVSILSKSLLVLRT